MTHETTSCNTLEDIAQFLIIRAR